ncbi:heterokaryon incompatibility protein-domain-containing protein [Xylaria bambusicola]|uniref:heterokaryon incompatibility protein-domain-containing protein n=1 Tax=Xylaria bambusicola TaxID=326684 RepID=UPI0020085487|nr:heterokaryon incompatibility protein-domain-containing protein [Xylaria bambusicola]KAI0502834.1 heterokaryon incompatibility protein-domain-containing protein [Xylaria bambusicola]
MWLLNSCTWEMREFISHKQAPPYAILSHTWGDEEVSFREWQYEPMRDIEKKEGFRKIDFCCKQAADDGLEWVWIDTCCIDKSSSAELSEAINSMFQWYKSAAICYAFLYDVSNTDSEFDLTNTRWVNRGWTLQELIAPREVIFYSKDWQALGTRSKLSGHIAKVTRINEPFLTGRSLDEASIAQRMSWAAKRTTSREEDEAYCLLGIFNVNMPLIYGEGPKAFRRLQEAIVREYPNDHSIFAWGPIAKTPSNTLSNSEQVWGRELIPHEPESVFDEFYGLLAESTRDFEQSGQIVIAPTAAKYFYLGSKMPSVSSLIGRIAHVDLPQYEVGPHVAFHVEYPRVGDPNSLYPPYRPSLRSMERVYVSLCSLTIG